MERIQAAFRGLRGRLTLSYVAVTVAALLALEVVALAIIFGISWAFGANQAQYVNDVVFTLGPQAAEYYANGRWDETGLQAWADETHAGGVASLPPQSWLDAPQAEIAGDAPLLVLDNRGDIVAAAPATARDLVGRPYAPPDFSGASAVVARARRNELDQVAVAAPNGDLFLAFSIRNDRQQAVGAMVLMVEPPPSYLVTVGPALLRIVLVTGAILIAGVTPFGALFGFLTARGLSRRLQRLEKAADAWREGAFDHRLPPQEADEIGRLAERLRQMAESVQSLMQTRQALAAMEERNRLARELHDTVKQQSFAMLMQVRAAQNLLASDPAAARIHLGEVETLLKASQQELAMIIAELRPAALEGKGLAGALEAYLEAWSTLMVIEAELAVEGERSLPLAAEQALYRIAQEALANVARHSDASRVEVGLTGRSHAVTLTVADNGRGFDPVSTQPGFGLTSMRQRAEQLGGQMQIDAHAAGGTRIAVHIPLSEEKTV